jgi:NAD(P)-dependent dehydrogenase (short-subunit alcohol dehydrogenase family)
MTAFRDFDKHVVIVTGGTGALGQAISRRFLSAGAAVGVPFVVPEEAEALREGLAAPDRERLHLVDADVGDPDRFGSFARETLGRFGRIDILVNAVGGFEGGDLVSTTPEIWQRMLTLNLTTCYIACRGVLPAMMQARGGRIVNIASRAVVPPRGGFMAYTVAKSGVLALTQALAEEARPHGITVNAVLPSTMDTPANRRAMPDADRSEWVSVESVAAVVVFLAGPEARVVTGGRVAV